MHYNISLFPSYLQVSTPLYHQVLLVLCLFCFCCFWVCFCRFDCFWWFSKESVFLDDFLGRTSWGCAWGSKNMVLDSLEVNFGRFCLKTASWRPWLFREKSCWTKPYHVCFFRGSFWNRPRTPQIHSKESASKGFEVNSQGDNITLLTITTMIAQYLHIWKHLRCAIPPRTRRNVCHHGSAPTRGRHPSWAANSHDFVGADEMWSKLVGNLMNLPRINKSTNSGGEQCLLFFRYAASKTWKLLRIKGFFLL